jgi:hypothetical protein
MKGFPSIIKKLTFRYIHGHELGDDFQHVLLFRDVTVLVLFVKSIEVELQRNDMNRLSW